MPSKADLWMPLYIGDYTADTLHLTTEQHGAYLLLMLYYWRQGSPVDNDGVLASVTKLTVERWLEQRPVLVKLFTIRRGVWHHKRIDVEIERAKNHVENRVKAGRKGGRKKAENQRLASDTTVSLIAEGKRKGTPSPSPRDSIPSGESLAHPSGALGAPDGAPSSPPLNGADHSLPGIEETKPPPRQLPCPHEAILALWAEVLPHLPRHSVLHWHETRRANLQTRWRETAVAKGWTEQQEGLNWFRRFFEYIGQSEFLTGGAPGRNGSTPFIAELEWVIKRANWAKLAEGKYHQTVG